MPQVVFDENSDVNEDCLRNLIRDCEVNDAIFVYKLMQTKQLPINDDLKQELLELICFYNHEDTISDDYIEERWFKQSSLGRGNREPRQRKTWKDGDLAEELFNEMKSIKTVESYSAIIRGMCKYYQVERGWQLFQEALDKNLQLDTDTFNSIISIVSFLKDTGELRWELCKDLLKQMKECKLSPNINTLNSILATISTIGNYRLARSATLKTLSEFKALNITPCLASWYYVLITLCRERGPVSHALVDILNHIEGKEFVIQNPKDTYFFVTAMDICRNHLHDKNLAKRVDKLLHTGNNYNFIGDSYKESIYYRHLFVLLCQTETLDKFFTDTYDLLVPNIYIPEPGIMEEILKTIDINGSIEYIPRIWSDMIIFDHISRENLIIHILKIMTLNRPDPQNYPNHQDLNEKFGLIAWDIYSRASEQFNDNNLNNIPDKGGRNNISNNRQQKINLTGQMLGDILCLLSRNHDYEKAAIVFKILNKNQYQIAGIPLYDEIEEFINLCIEMKQPTQAITCIEYCIENNLTSNISELIKKVKDGFTLSEMHLSKLKSLIGSEI